MLTRRRLALHGERALFLRPAGIALTLPLPEVAGLFAAALVRLFGYLGPQEAVGGDPDALTAAAASAPEDVPAAGPASTGEELPINDQVAAYCQAVCSLYPRLLTLDVRAALESAWRALAAHHLQDLTAQLQSRVALIGRRQPARQLRQQPAPPKSAPALTANKRLQRQQLQQQLQQRGVGSRRSPPASFPKLSGEERWAVVGGFLKTNVDPLWRETADARRAKVAVDALRLLALLTRAAASGAINLDVASWRAPDLGELVDEEGDELVLLPDVWGTCMLRPSATPSAGYPGLEAESLAPVQGATQSHGKSLAAAAGPAQEV